MNSTDDIVVVPPVYESLFDVHRRDFWPESVLENPEIQAEMAERKELVSCLGLFFGLQNKELELTAAVDAGLVTETQAAELYSRLAEFLTAKEHNQRLLLYLPFELIPDARWQTSSRELAQAVSRFKDVYLKSWHGLLSQRDVRACFVDGDVFEPGVGPWPLPKVVKAAHFAWVLVSKGLITSSQVIKLIETSADKVLRQSLADSVKVMLDLGLVDSPSEIAESSDPLVRQLAATSQGSEVNQERLVLPSNLGQLRELVPQIRHEQSCLEQSLGDLRWGVSDRRIAWLRQRDSQVIIKNFAERIACALAEGLISVADLKEFFLEHIQDEFLVLVAIEAACRFLEEIAKRDLTAARTAHTAFETELALASRFSSIAVDAAVEGLRLRFSYLGVTTQRGVDRPGEVFCPERTFGNGQLGKLASIVEAIRTDDRLSRMLYPVLLVYGSRAKGYAPHNADFDLAVMVRPWVDLNLRTSIQDALARAAEKGGIKASFLEFWLEWESCCLKIRDFKERDGLMGGNDTAHVLFEAVWIGGLCEIRPIFSSLVSRFLLPDHGIIQAVKGLLLAEIERSTLQFRLMHKGYAYMYPLQGGISTRNSSAIDSESVFWDKGYRQLATKLFVTRVFLPDCS
jgi:hypothetical protein